MITTTMKPYKRDVLMCGCGFELGRWADDLFLVSKVGLILCGGLHKWCCPKCGITQDVDLR